MCSAAALACWSGVPPAKLRYCFAARTAAIRGAGPVAQPIFQPVAENVLPIEEIVTVRSAMPSQRGERDVLALVDEVLVDLVGDRDEVVLPAHGRDLLELAAVEHLARGVVGRVEQQQPGAGGDRRLERRRIQVPVGRAQRDRAAAGAGHRDAGGV